MNFDYLPVLGAIGSDYYHALLAAHILMVVIWVGGGITIHILIRRARRIAEPSEVVRLVHEANWIGTRIFAPASLILLVLGILLVVEADPIIKFSEFWVNVGFVGFLVSFLIGILYYSRQEKKMDAWVAEGGPSDPRVVANISQVAMVNSFELLILILVIIDMAVKPGQSTVI
jgi:uncharacterized membrane protein